MIMIQKPQRQSIRLQTWDYSSSGYYFVTICTFQRQNLFENPQFYDIGVNALLNISRQISTVSVELDEWVVMPNHIHAILILINNFASVDMAVGRSGSLGAVIGQYKATVTTRINHLRHQPKGKVWQRGYYERIIRTEEEWQASQKYIVENPLRWAEDNDNLDKLVQRMTYSKV